MMRDEVVARMRRLMAGVPPQYVYVYAKPDGRERMQAGHAKSPEGTTQTKTHGVSLIHPGERPSGLF